MTRDVTAVVVSFQSRDDLPRCLASLRAAGERLLETIVVDNASGDGSAEVARKSHPEARVIENSANVGFAGAANRGLREAKGRYVLLLNPDAALQDGALDTLARFLDDHRDVAIVGPRTLNDDGTPQVSFGSALSLVTEWRQRRLVLGVKRRDPAALAQAAELSSRPGEPDWVSGACFLARLDALRAVGLFDEGFFLYEEDVDLCVRVKRAGGRVAFLPEAVVVHSLGKSMAQASERAGAEYRRSHLRYYAKHRGPLETLALRLFRGL